MSTNRPISKEVSGLILTEDGLVAEAAFLEAGEAKMAADSETSAPAVA